MTCEIIRLFQEKTMNEPFFDIPAMIGLGNMFLATVLLIVSLDATCLAKKKGYSGHILFWAWIPLVSVYGLFLFATLPDLHVRARVDVLAARLVPPKMGPLGRRTKTAHAIAKEIV